MRLRLREMSWTMNSNDNQDFEVRVASHSIDGDTPPEQDGAVVEILPQVLGELRDYARTEIDTELGAFLLGRVLSGPDPARPRTRIEAWIEAKHADNRGANITFTHQTWEYVNNQKDTLYPEMKMVGWFHTHPGFGIFLSSYDLFIHENFFKEAGQVALVMDPRSNKTGAFSWQEGQVVQLPMYTLGAEDGSRPGPAGVLARHGRSVALGASLLVTGFLAGFLMFSYIPAWYNGEQTPGRAYQDAREELDSAATLASRQVQLAPLHASRTMENRQIWAGVDQGGTDPSGGYYLQVNVQSGDSLARLASTFNLDSSSIDTIAELNRLDDPDFIMAGQVLRIPVPGKLLEPID